MAFWSRRKPGSEHSTPLASVVVPVEHEPGGTPIQADPAPTRDLAAIEAEVDAILQPLRDSVTPERWAQLGAAARALDRPDDDAYDAEDADDLDTLRYLDLLTADEEDILVESMVGDIKAEMLSGPTSSTVTQLLATLIENQIRCRVRATATVIASVGTVPFDPADPAAGDLVTVDVMVEGPAAAGRFRLTSPCETPEQRTLLSTPGNRLTVMLAARDPSRITVDFDVPTPHIPTPAPHILTPDTQTPGA